MLALEFAEESVLVADVLGRRLTYGLMALPKSRSKSVDDQEELWRSHPDADGGRRKSSL